MLKRLILIIAVFMLGATLVMAGDGVDDQGNPNDPTVNDRANACFDGGSMAGQCDSFIEWIAGWYLIRVEYGVFTRDQMPTWLTWVLPPEAPSEPAPPPAPITCFTNGTNSLKINNLNARDGSILYYGATDCENGPAEFFTTLTADSLAEANTACDNTYAGATEVTGRWSDQGYNTPTNYWGCRALLIIPP